LRTILFAVAMGNVHYIILKVPLSHNTQWKLCPSSCGVHAQFVEVEGPKDKTEFFKYTFNNWLKESLEKGDFLSTSVTKTKVIEGGLQSANAALDELKKGVSGVKLVIEL
jgi:hypothetical protein